LDIGDGLALVMKIESHNHPSAVEPYQGAATGVGGIVRDIFAMVARPVVLMDSLRFGSLGEGRTNYLFEQVVAGISDYGNCIGVPTVGGEIYFQDCYQKSPLVNALCAGIVEQDKMQTGKPVVSAVQYSLWVLLRVETVLEEPALPLRSLEKTLKRSSLRFKWEILSWRNCSLRHAWKLTRQALWWLFRIWDSCWHNLLGF